MRYLGMSVSSKASTVASGTEVGLIPAGLPETGREVLLGNIDRGWASLKQQVLQNKSPGVCHGTGAQPESYDETARSLTAQAHPIDF